MHASRRVTGIGNSVVSVRTKRCLGSDSQMIKGKFEWAAVADQFQPHFLVRPHEMEITPGSASSRSSKLQSLDARRVIYCNDDDESVLMAQVYDASNSFWKFQYKLLSIFRIILLSTGLRTSTCTICRRGTTRQWLYRYRACFDCLLLGLQTDFAQ